MPKTHKQQNLKMREIRAIKCKGNKENANTRPVSSRAWFKMHFELLKLWKNAIWTPRTEKHTWLGHTYLYNVSYILIGRIALKMPTNVFWSEFASKLSIFITLAQCHKTNPTWNKHTHAYWAGLLSACIQVTPNEQEIEKWLHLCMCFAIEQKR